METVALEQYYNAIPREIAEVAEWLSDQQTATLMEAAGKVVEYQQNHKSKENGRYPRGDTFREPKRNKQSNEVYKSRQIFRKKDYRDIPMERESPANKITCYNCRKLGHIAKNCPEKAFLIKESPVDNMCCKGEVIGKFGSNIQIDTGACRTVVREDLVSRQI